MNIFSQIMKDLKVAREAQEDTRVIEDMPANILKRTYVSASHIVLPSVESAEDVQQRIADGEISFEDAARQFSMCRTKAKGGSLGSFKSLARILFLPYESKFSAVAPFDEIVFDRSRELGAVSLVVTEFGAHLIKVTARDVKL